METQAKSFYRVTQIVGYLVMVLEAFLLLRFILKLMQANPQAGFSSFVYGVSGFFTAPFEAVFRNLKVSGSVFEWTTILAMIIYGIVAWGIIKLFSMGRPVGEIEAQNKLSEQDR